MRYVPTKHSIVVFNAQRRVPHAPQLRVGLRPNPSAKPHRPRDSRIFRKMAFLPDGHPPFPMPRYLANWLLAGFFAVAFRFFITFIPPLAAPSGRNSLASLPQPRLALSLY